MTTLRHLVIFIKVAECKTMRMAAQELYISQPSVSQAIQELEQTYNVRLFDRIGKKIFITEAGKVMLSYAREVTGCMERMEESMRAAAQAPIIKVGASVTVGIVYIEGFVSRLEKQFPGLDVRVTVDNTMNIEKLTAENLLDFGIVEGMVGDENLIQKKICKDNAVLAVGRSHPYFDYDSITINDLEGQALISRESGSSDRNQVEQFLVEKNIHMVKKWCSTNTEAIKQAAVAGRGIAIISKSLIEKEIEDNALKVLNVSGLNIERSFKFIYHKDKNFDKKLYDAVLNAL